MNTPTEPRKGWSRKERPRKGAQWAWFAGIWLASLLAVLLLSYMIKFLMSLI